MNLHDVYDDGSTKYFEPIEEAYEELCSEVAYLLSGYDDRELWDLIEADRLDREYYGKPLDRKWKTAPSLKAGLPLLESAVHGNNPEAREAVNSWKFNFPITVVSPEQFAAMVAKSEGTYFHGTKAQKDNQTNG